MSTIERLKQQKEFYTTKNVTAVPVSVLFELWQELPKLLAFVLAYDHWLDLYMQDAREDLEDDDGTRLKSAVENLDAARKALDEETL